MYVTYERSGRLGCARLRNFLASEIDRIVPRAIALAMYAMLAFASAAHAVCPFTVDTVGNGVGTRDGTAFVQLARRDNANALQARERTTHEHVAAHLARLDLNADGVYDTVDALIAARAMLGFRNEALTEGLGFVGARSSATAIQSFIDGGCVVDTASDTTWRAASFTESNATITNPERGWWVFLSDNIVNVADSDIVWVQTTYPEVALGYAVVRLDNYRNQTLPQSFLDSITAAFAKVRARGMKVVLRFAYNYPGSEASPVVDDAPLARVLEHIGQISPIVQANSDVVFVWQAGFIGMWGEGHSSTNGLDSPANKTTIRDALLNVLPNGRFLMWRYPPDQIAWDAAPGEEADAFGTSRKARIGMYNDCFMSSPTDVGTYDDDATIRAQQRNYVATRSAIVPFGGETCNAASAAQQRRSCSAILSEGAQFHMSYLNRTYYDAFHTQWQTEGCFDEVSRKLGYRWILTDSNVPLTIARGQSASASVTMKNVGWARLYNPRALKLLLVSRSNPGATPIELVTAHDPRALKPGEERSFLFNGAIGSGATAGLYDVFVAAPDAATTLAANARYSIRFANSDNAAKSQAWDATRGAFKTGLTVTVQ
jgi:Domain of unknown function (DUF4832)/Domain of unknown function (DUF4874)